MPNRAERRAQAKAGRRGVPSQYDQTRGRGRSGMIDEYQLQQKSQRLQDGTDGTEWKPSGLRVLILTQTAPRFSAFYNPACEVSEAKNFHRILTQLPRIQRALNPRQREFFHDHSFRLRALA